MEFDPDRLAKLAGISGADAATTTAAPHNPASAPGGLIRESAASSRRAPESKEVKQLRQLIRAEASQMIREMRSQRAGSRLSESVTMGFYGPGFAGSRASALGGPITSSGRLSRLFENEDAGIAVTPGAVKDAKDELADNQSEIESALADAGMDADAVKREIASLRPTDIENLLKSVNKASGDSEMLAEGWKPFLASLAASGLGFAGLIANAHEHLDKTDPATIAMALVLLALGHGGVIAAAHTIPDGRDSVEAQRARAGYSK
jgi:hypothetical protein